MRCTNCGQEVAAGLKFCTSCGTPVQMKAPSQVEEESRPQPSSPVPYQNPYPDQEENYYRYPNQPQYYPDPYRQRDPYSQRYYNRPYGYAGKIEEFFQSFRPGNIAWRQFSMIIAVILLLFSFLSVMGPTRYGRDNSSYYGRYRRSLFGLADAGDNYFITYLFLMSIFFIIVLLIMNRPWLSCLGYMGIIHSLGEANAIIDDDYYLNGHTSFGMWFLLFLAMAGLFCALVAGDKEKQPLRLPIPIVWKYGGGLAILMSYLAKYFTAGRTVEYIGFYDRRIGTDGVSLSHLSRYYFGYMLLVGALLVLTIFAVSALMMNHPGLSMIGSGGMAICAIILMIIMAARENCRPGYGAISMLVFALLAMIAGLFFMLESRSNDSSYDSYSY